MSAKCVCSLLSGEDVEHCALSNVLSSVIAVAISACACFMYWANRGGVKDCLEGMGGGAASLTGMVNLSTFIYTTILLLNVTSMAAIWLSFFHCEKFENAFKHALTSSRSLCWLRIVCSVSFVVQIFRSGYAMAFHGSVAFLAFLCNQGPGVVYLAQELIYAIGNSSTPGDELDFVQGAHRYGYHAASSPYLDVGRALTGMNLDSYCTESGSEDAAANVVVSCVIMSIISQALMVCALNGEKERVTVHELHEHQAAQEAGAEGGAAFGSERGLAEQLPLLAQGAAATAATVAVAAAPHAADVAAKAAPVVGGVAMQAAPHVANGLEQGASAAFGYMMSPQGQQQLQGLGGAMGSLGSAALTAGGVRTPTIGGTPRA